jgi:glycosyltransferase involved in cell wall biosynthesis
MYATPTSFTVLTPTYNRAYTLTNVYDCLCQQTLQDFEWLIIDDGSSDQTEALVQQWLDKAPFPIRYLKKNNGGKHTALNLGIQEAKGYFTVILDSDDVMKPTCLERFLYHWQSIPESEREHYAGITALCEDQNGYILGGKFPSDTFDSNAVEITYLHRLSDDRYGMQRSEVMRAFPFPEFQNEKFLTESVVWNRIARHYKNRYVNEILCVKEYRADGLTRSVSKHLCKNPKGSSLYYQELLGVKVAMSAKVRLGVHAYYVRYALHAGQDVPGIVTAMKRPGFRLLGGLLGSFLYLRDKTRSVRSPASPQQRLGETRRHV